MKEEVSSKLSVFLFAFFSFYQPVYGMILDYSRACLNSHQTTIKINKIKNEKKTF